jgi:hypothetical protein
MPLLITTIKDKMMNINKSFTFGKWQGCIGMLLLLSVGCTKKFEAFNTDPNRATEEMLKADNLTTGSYFKQMESNVFPIAQQPDFGDEVYQTMQNLQGDVWSGYMGASNNWFSNSNNTTYNLIPQWYGQAFNRGFVGIMPAWNSIKTEAQTASPQVYAVATIVKVEGMHRITDMYGPLPYLSFGNGALKNNYDSQKDVYFKFFDELNEAIAILTDFDTKSPGATVLAKYDYIFDGNVKSWIRFANSLKLRLATRIVYADAARAKLEAEAAVAHPIGVMTAATDIAALKHTTGLTYNHPLFIICENFGDIRMGANMESFLLGYADPRLPAYFKTGSDGLYHGIRTGITIANKADYSEGPFSRLNVVAGTSIVWMNPAEVYFLRAEGALRGWNMGSDAQTLYETGIRTSFTVSGVATGVDAYIANNTAKAAGYADPKNTSYSVPLGDMALSTITVKWNTTGTTEENLERIITQKWISMFPDGQEAWSEFRRTGYPKLFPVKVNNSNGLIPNTVRRIPFPSAEYQTNASGVAGAISLLGNPDNGGSKLWWDKK